MGLSLIDIPACSSTIKRRLSANALWSLGGNVVSTLTGLLVVKITCQRVEPADYGAASLIPGCVLAFVNSAVIGPIMTAHLRLFFDYSHVGLEVRFAKAFRTVLFFAILCSVAIYIAIAAAYRIVGQSIYVKLLLPAVCLIVTQAFLTLITNHLEARRSYRPLAFANVASKGSQLAALFPLLAAQVSGVNAILFSQVAANIATNVLYRRRLKLPDVEEPERRLEDEASVCVDSLVVKFVKFGWALPCGTVASWILATGDRYVLEHFVSIREVGRYTMNYGFWSIPFLLLNGWLELLTRPRLYAAAAAQQWTAVADIIRYRLGSGFAIGSVGLVSYIVAGKSLAFAMLGERYWAGGAVMVTIGLAHLFYVAGYSIVPFFAAKQPNKILWAISAAAAIDMTYDIFAIRSQGILGAAIGTLLGYITFVVVALILARRLIHLYKLDSVSR